VNIAIEKKDAVMLAFCMDIMKDNCKGTLRKNLGIREGKKQFKVYKSVLKSLEDQLIEELDEPENELMELECSTEQSEVVREFISSFLEILEDEERQEQKEAYAAPLENVLTAFLIAEADAMAAVV